MGQARLVEASHSDEWPEELKRALKKAVQDNGSWKPIIVEMHHKDAVARFDELIRKNNIRQIIDNYDEQYAELIVSRHPQLYQSSLEIKRESLKEYLKEHFGGNQSWRLGSWVYYPWTGMLVHILEKSLFLESHTIRNKDLLDESEQRQYAELTVGCAGMSVGSNVALSLALSGGSQKIKLADGAVISASNLNRMMTGVHDVGNSKSLVVARKLYEMNPYMEIERFDRNITEGTVAEFFEQSWPLDVVVDEIDDLKMKILLRIEARRRKLPVMMATDLGDDVMLDVERFDLNPELPLFHGLVPNVEELLTKEMSKREWLKYATSIIGPQNTPLRMQQSLLKVGTKLVTQPQLGTTALMAGAVTAYAIRQLAVSNELRSGRTIVSLDKHLRPDLVTIRHRLQHKKHTRQLKRALKSM